MDDPRPPLVAETDSTDDAPTLIDDLRQLAADGRTLLEAELVYQKSRAAVAGQAARSVAGWGALALSLVFFALMALVFGAVLALAAKIGAIAATIVVVVILLAGAALAAGIAARRWKRTAAQLAGEEEPS